MRGAFFGILGARALHRLVFLTELVVQLERTPRGIVLGDDGLERDDHAAAAKRQEQRVELRTGKTACVFDKQSPGPLRCALLS